MYSTWARQRMATETVIGLFELKTDRHKNHDHEKPTPKIKCTWRLETDSWYNLVTHKRLRELLFVLFLFKVYGISKPTSDSQLIWLKSFINLAFLNKVWLCLRTLYIWQARSLLMNHGNDVLVSTLFCANAASFCRQTMEYVDQSQREICQMFKIRHFKRKDRIM